MPTVDIADQGAEGGGDLGNLPLPPNPPPLSPPPPNAPNEEEGAGEGADEVGEVDDPQKGGNKGGRDGEGKKAGIKRKRGQGDEKEGKTQGDGEGSGIDKHHDDALVGDGNGGGEEGEKNEGADGDRERKRQRGHDNGKSDKPNPEPNAAPVPPLPPQDDARPPPVPRANDPDPSFPPRAGPKEADAAGHRGAEEAGEAKKDGKEDSEKKDDNGLKEEDGIGDYGKGEGGGIKGGKGEGPVEESEQMPNEGPGDAHDVSSIYSHLPPPLAAKLYEFTAPVGKVYSAQIEDSLDEGEVGKTLQFAIEDSKIGEGGSGSVYRAVQRRGTVGRRGVRRVYKLARRAMQEEFKRGRKLRGKIGERKCIAKVHRVGKLTGSWRDGMDEKDLAKGEHPGDLVYFLEMEEYQTWEEMVDDLKKVVAESRTAAGVEIIKEVVKGMKEILLTFLELSQAHRVIKPDNLMRADDAALVAGDFGSVIDSGHRVVGGTHVFASDCFARLAYNSHIYARISPDGSKAHKHQLSYRDAKKLLQAGDAIVQDVGFTLKGDLQGFRYSLIKLLECGLLNSSEHPCDGVVKPPNDLLEEPDIRMINPFSTIKAFVGGWLRAEQEVTDRWFDTMVQCVAIGSPVLTAIATVGDRMERIIGLKEKDVTLAQITYIFAPLDDL